MRSLWRARSTFKYAWAQCVLHFDIRLWWVTIGTRRPTAFFVPTFAFYLGQSIGRIRFCCQQHGWLVLWDFSWLCWSPSLTNQTILHPLCVYRRLCYRGAIETHQNSTSYQKPAIQNDESDQLIINTGLSTMIIYVNKLKVWIRLYDTVIIGSSARDSYTGINYRHMIWLLHLIGKRQPDMR